METIKGQPIFSQLINRVRKKAGKDKDLKEIATGGATAFLINASGTVLSYIFVFVLSRIYHDSSSTIYGQYVIITIVIRIGSILSRFGTDTNMLKLTAALKTKKLWGNILENEAKLLKLLLGIGLGVSLLVALFSRILGVLLKVPHDLILAASFFILPMAVGLFYAQALRGLRSVILSTFLRNSALSTINFVLLLALFPFFKTASFFTHLPAYTFLGAVLITCIIGYVGWRRSVPNEYKTLYEQEHRKTTSQLFGMAYPLVLAESMIFITSWIEQLMIGLLGNIKDVGIYNLCNRYTMAASLTLAAVNQISAPRFAEYFFEKNYSQLAKTVQQTTKVISLTTLPIVLLYIIFPKFFLGIFGESFTSGWLAFIFLSIGCLISVMCGSVAVLLQMTGYQKTVQNVLIVTLLVEITLNAFLIPAYGITGAGLASAFCSILKNLALSFYVKKYFNFYGFYIPFTKKGR